MRWLVDGLAPVVILAVVLTMNGRTWGQADTPIGPDPTNAGPLPYAAVAEMGPLETAAASLFGDAYDSAAWRPLTMRSFFREGWLEPWAAGPAGRDGLTPRHGWLGAFEGLFFRLWLTPFMVEDRLRKSFGGESYSGSFAIFLPLSRRFEVFLNVPYVRSNGTDDPDHGYRHDFGDLVVTPRFLLQESVATTQVLNLEVRAPTGRPETGGGKTALTPRYAFWTNPGGPWVARGAAGFFIPLNQDDGRSGSDIGPGPLGQVRTGTETSFVGGLAVGRYFRPHDVPFGDLVFYAASNLNTPLGPNLVKTYVGAGLGTRFHLANNYYFLNYWEVPVAGPRPYEYSMQLAILKTF